MATTHIRANATPKKQYQFRVSARNIYGRGPTSAPVILSTGQRPSPPSPISAVNPKLANGTLNYDQIKIDWTAPADNGSPITRYEVLILKKNNTVGGSFVEDKSVCDGSTKVNGNLRLTCTLNSSDLVSKFNYKIADRLVAVVKACNKVGCSN